VVSFTPRPLYPLGKNLTNIHAKIFIFNVFLFLALGIGNCADSISDHQKTPLDPEEQ
jgi:hypothetical protein